MSQLAYFHLQQKKKKLNIGDREQGEKTKSELKPCIIAHAVFLHLAAWQLNSSSSLQYIEDHIAFRFKSMGAMEKVVSFEGCGDQVFVLKKQLQFNRNKLLPVHPEV